MFEVVVLVTHGVVQNIGIEAKIAIANFTAFHIMCGGLPMRHPVHHYIKEHLGR